MASCSFKGFLHVSSAQQAPWALQDARSPAFRSQARCSSIRKSTEEGAPPIYGTCPHGLWVFKTTVRRYRDCLGPNCYPGRLSRSPACCITRIYSEPSCFSPHHRKVFFRADMQSSRGFQSAKLARSSFSQTWAAGTHSRSRPSLNSSAYHIHVLKLLTCIKSTLSKKRTPHPDSTLPGSPISWKISGKLQPLAIAIPLALDPLAGAQEACLVVLNLRCAPLLAAKPVAG